MGQILTFQVFKTKEEATAVAATLEKAGIPALVEDAGYLLDNNIIGVQYDDPILLKIDADHFEQARKILADEIVIDLDTVDKDYMLLSMTDDELLDVVAKPDEWGLYNYKLAMLLLAKHGRHIEEQQLTRLQEARYEQLAAPKAFDKSWIRLGYLISVAGIIAALWQFFMTILSFFGLVLGWAIMSAKTTLPDGKRALKYDENSRWHGRNMFLLGLATAIIALVVLLRRSLG